MLLISLLVSLFYICEPEFASRHSANLTGSCILKNEDANLCICLSKKLQVGTQLI